MKEKDLYSRIIEKIFLMKYKPGMKQMDFQREDIMRVCGDLGVQIPKNLGDLIYSFRYRKSFPESIRSKAGKGETWIIRPTGRSKYRFVLIPDRPLKPNKNIAITKIPDATPGIVNKYSLTDEQALLARVRYNRLIDIFSGVTCYSLQNHLRTTVPGIGQIETDEIYVGIDKKGAHYVFPVQAKGKSDRVGIVQTEQDFALCSSKFPSLICRPITAQFIEDEVIVLFEFEQSDDGVRITSEKHYKLVPAEDVTEKDLDTYSKRLSN